MRMFRGEALNKFRKPQEREGELKRYSGRNRISFSPRQPSLKLAPEGESGTP
jgi:hypothetical protein